MVNDRCLDCGRVGHFAGSAACAKSQRAACLSSSSASVVSLPKAPVAKCLAVASGNASTLVVAAAAKFSAPALAKPKAVASSATVSAAVDDVEARFGSWLSRKRLRDDNGWIPLKPVLIALGEPWKNPGRYLEVTSDSPSKLWTLGKQKRTPRMNEDYKRAVSGHGGNKPYVVRKTFLKRVMNERYKAIL